MHFDDGYIIGSGISKEVKINGKLLDPTISQKILNHSPDGFNWGYCGSGPAQLAFAILLELYDEKIAKKYYQEFKNQVISKLALNLPFRLSIDTDFLILKCFFVTIDGTESYYLKFYYEYLPYYANYGAFILFCTFLKSRENKILPLQYIVSLINAKKIHSTVE